MLVCALAIPTVPFASYQSAEVKAANVATATVGSRVNLFKGTKEATAWQQVVTFDTTNSYGTLDTSIIQEGGYFEATVEGKTDSIQMIFQSWMGGGGWCIVNPTETVSLDNGKKLARFSYNDIVASYGTKIDLLNRIYFNTSWDPITLYSLDYVTGETDVTEKPTPTATPVWSPSLAPEPTSTVVPSTPSPSIVCSTKAPVTTAPVTTEPVTTAPVTTAPVTTAPVTTAPVTTAPVTTAPVTTAPVTNAPVTTAPVTTAPVTTAPVTTAPVTTAPGVSLMPYNSVPLYDQEISLIPNSTNGKIVTKKNGGTLDPSMITEDGYIAVGFKGTRNACTLVFSSWTGGPGWQMVKPTAVKRQYEDSFIAIYSYDTITEAYGTDLSTLDSIYFAAQGSPYSINRVCYVPENVDLAIASCNIFAPATPQPYYIAGTLEERSYKADASHVKVLGRTYEDANGSRWLNNLCSGVEFTFTGTKASIDVQAVSNETQFHLGRIAIYVNDKLVVDDMIDELEKTYDFYESDLARVVTVKIMRLSESAYIPFAIDNIRVTSTADIKPAYTRERKIEFIGDSITVGYGVDEQSTSASFSTSNSDGTKSFAYKTAQKLGAEYSAFAASGFGIISGYTGGDINTLQTIPQYYNSDGFSWYYLPDGKQPMDIAYDFNSYVPDAVVINLGTNDSSYTRNDAGRKAEFVKAYIAFLKQVREKNAGATIFCTLGIMGQDLYPQIEEAVASYKAETGDTNIYCLEFDVQDTSNDGVCVDWHPTEKTYEKAAETLAEYMSYIMGW